MKKLLFGLTFLGSLMITGISANAQEEEEPCPEGTPTTSWGGVCCASMDSCDHPYAGNIADSTWTRCVATCS